MNRGKANLLFQSDNRQCVGIMFELSREDYSIDLISLNRIKNAPVLRFGYRAVQTPIEKGNPQFFCWPFRPFASGPVGISSSRNIDDVDELRHSFGKHLKALTPDFNSRINADAGDVAARPSDVRYYSKTNGITGHGDNRNTVRS